MKTQKKKNSTKKCEMQRNCIQYRILLLCLGMIMIGIGCTGNTTKVPETTMTGTPSPSPTQPGTGTESPTPDTMPPKQNLPTGTPAPTVTPTPATNPLDVAYWIQKMAGKQSVLSTQAEIAEMNELNYSNPKTGLVRLAQKKNWTADKVKSMIESLSIPNKKYFANRLITETDKAELIKQTNLAALKQKEMEVTYGIVTENCDVRTFPTKKRLTNEENGRYDYFQETKLLIGEVVAILHQTSDKEWFFVQAENYFGWVNCLQIAKCSETEAMNVLTRSESQTAVAIQTFNIDINGTKTILRMGTKLTLETGESGGSKAGNPLEFMVQIPIRTADGFMSCQSLLVTGEQMTIGFLPYTRENMIGLAAKLVDTPYSWGDEGTGMDCSSTLAAIFRCFGFVMPRNTGAIREMTGISKDISGTLSERKQQLDQLEAGTFLFLPGHIMLYLGSSNGKYYILHNTTESVDVNGKLLTYFRCCVTTVSIGKSNNTLLERMTRSVMIH